MSNETLTIFYERKINDGNYGSEGLSLGMTMSVVEDELGATVMTLHEKVRGLVLSLLAASEAPRVAAVAAAELNGKLPKPQDELDLEDLPFDDE